ncbi:MAG: heavy metal-binding domain-containing protein [Ezakiella sp.]|nr:heavy metal-binding domain-containing protein [Ezakiella sp.]
MILTTTQSVDGFVITDYIGIEFGEAITGVNFLKDLGASFRDIFGGRSKGYEEELIEARSEALLELERRAARLGANAVVGIKIDYETLGEANGMLMVTASGTAVKINRK